MALIDVVVLSAPDHASHPPSAVAPDTPGGVAAFHHVAELQAAVPGTADVVVVIDEGSELIPEWYLHVLVAVEDEPERLHTPPVSSNRPGGACAFARRLVTRPGFAEAVAQHLAGERAPQTPPPVTRGPLVSVFLPTFNRRTLLGRALECLARQTYEDVEVVVVNDGGLDPSAVVDRYRDRLDVRLYTQSANLGRSLAYNRAIAEAKGRWMMGLADDDTVQPEHIANLVAHALQVPGPVVTYGPAWHVHEDQLGNELHRGLLLDGARHRSFLMVENFVFAETSLFERELALELGGFDPSLEVLEDWEFWIRLAGRSTLVRVPHATTDYRIRETVADNSLTTRGPARFFDTQQKIYQRYPVAAGSWCERIRAARLDALRPRQQGQHVFDHTIGVIGDGNVDALVNCLNSIGALAGRERIQVIVHEVRNDATESALSEMDGQIICLSDRYDPEHALARIAQQAGGRQVHVVSSHETVLA